MTNVNGADTDIGHGDLLPITFCYTDIGHGDLLPITKSYRGEIRGD